MEDRKDVHDLVSWTQEVRYPDYVPLLLIPYQILDLHIA